MAKALRFYDGVDRESTYDWSSFFPNAERFLDIISSTSSIAALEAHDCPPHLALMLAFIKQYGQVQDQLNGLTSTHLDFFYTKVIGEKRKNAIPDKLYIFIELARNISQYILAKGEVILAGNDSSGKRITYTTDNQVALNHTTISQLKAIHHSSQNDTSIYSFSTVNSTDGYGKPLPPGQGWYPFGDVNRNAKIAAEIGFGIMSPILLLKDGRRRITVSFSLSTDKKWHRDEMLTSDYFVAQITSGKQWITKNVKEFSYDNKKLTLVVELGEVDPETSPYDKSVHGYALAETNWPMLKVVFMPGYTLGSYKHLQTIQFTSITLRAEVEASTALAVRNDYGELDINKTFYPLGYTPVRGSNFFVGIPETYTKPLELIKLRIKWKGLPENFKIYYEGYKGSTNSLVKGKEDYKITAAVRYKKKWHDIPSGEYELFGDEMVLPISTDRSRMQDDPENENGLLRLTLSSPAAAFGHSLFPAVYAKAIITQLQSKDAPIPNEPYTPVIEYIEADYLSSDTIELGPGTKESFQYFHIKPFGLEAVELIQGGIKQVSFISGEFDQAGSLFIGLQNVEPPQQLSLFFHIREVTLRDKPEPKYSYLSPTGWKPLEAKQILSDSTAGLTQTGLLVVNLPADLTARNSTMPQGIYWIRVSVSTEAESFDQILDIKTNGVSCTLSSGSTDSFVNQMTVAPNSVTGLEKKRKEIKRLEQPYSSFGGQTGETESAYFQRVSERLRHKVRGISAWDLERIILDQFPDIYKVKCIQHSDSNGNTLPGTILIIVIPYVDPLADVKVLKPFVPNSMLRKIHEHTEKLISPHAKLIITNPNYEEVKISAKVNFKNQVDTGSYIRQLQIDLQRFLSPWAFRKANDIQLGSSIYKSSIIKFIEGRPYLNFISSIQISANGQNVEGELISLDEKTIMISSERHDIEATGHEGARCQANQGIQEMIVDINFEVQ
ncbi:MAG TPA: hypothetical protein VK658_18260 [Chryseolinea sp.]|nr:hypothetical protein [Chryseolinea sp.]